MTTPDLRLGIDLGGSKIEVLAMDRAGQTLIRNRVPTPKDDYEAILSAITQLILSTEKELSARGSVGIGIPGSLSKATGKVKNANTTCLIGRDLKGDLEARLARPVRVANDANCFTLSEASDGAAASASSVFGVILGTGVGGGLVVNRSIIGGVNSIAGEWGHNPLPWPTYRDTPQQPCYCGQHGCIETYLSGPGMAEQARLQHGVNLQANELLNLHPSPFENRAHFALCASKDSTLTESERVYAEYIDRLARGLATVINLFDPDVIVLGGGVSNVDGLYEDVPKRWGKYVFSDQVETQLLQNQHGDSSGVRGAAWLWGDTP